MYFRENKNTFFLLPSCAVGVDSDGLYFFEVAWLFWAAGVG